MLPSEMLICRQQLCPHPCRCFLIRSRPRFDVVMMLYRRHKLRTIARGLQDVQFYYMADASPASGFESFAVVENMIYQGKSTFRLAPTTYLGVGQLGVKSKIYSFLWALWLEVGPDQSLFRWNLGQILGLTTDRGTERAIADAPDVLKEFFASLGAEYTLPPRP